MSAAKIIAIVAGVTAAGVILFVLFLSAARTDYGFESGETRNREGRAIHVEEGVDTIKLLFSVDPNPVAPGTHLALKVSVTNVSKEPRKLSFRSSQRYDFWIIDSTGVEVWRWSDGRMFAQMLEDVTLKPGETLDFAESWDLTDASGAPVKEGEYSAYANVSADELRDKELKIGIAVGMGGS